MAIKGKSKPKARRAVTRGPRPVYVAVKRPLVQRRGFQIGILAAVLVLAAAAIAYGFVHEHNANHAAEQRSLLRRVATAYTTEAQTALSGVGQSSGFGFTLLPDLPTQIDSLRKGSAKPSDVEASAKSMEDQASKAGDAMSAIDAAGMIRGKGIEDQVFVEQLINGTVKMQNALRMEAVAAGILRDAAMMPPGEAKPLLDRADQARSTAETLFESGYSDWVSAQATAGIYQPPQPPTAGGGLPTGS